MKLNTKVFNKTTQLILWMNSLPQIKQGKSLDVTKKPLEHGQRKERLNTPNHEQDVGGDTTSLNFSVRISPLKSTTSTGESPPTRRKVIWRDKLSSSALEEKITKLLKTSEAVLTSRGRDFKPFWTPQVKENSEKLWLPTETDSQDSRLNYSKTCFQGLPEQKSWFSTMTEKVENKSSWEILSQSSLSSQAESTDSAGTRRKSKNSSQKPPTPLKTLKVKLLLSAEEKTKIKAEIFAPYRWYYNVALGVIGNTPDNSFKTGKDVSDRKVRDHMMRCNLERVTMESGVDVLFVSEKDIDEKKKFPVPHWWDAKNPPNARIARGAIFEASRNFNSALSNKRNGNIKRFFLKPKTSKDCIYTSYFEDSGCPAFLKGLTGWWKKGRKKITLQEIIKDEGLRGFNVQWDRDTNKFWMFIPVKCDNPLFSKTKSENQAVDHRKEIISLDTGVRTFQTGYSPDGEITHICKGSYMDLVKLLESSDKKTGKAKKKVFQRIRNKVSDLHWKTIRFLTQNYKTVIIPSFDISGMVKGKLNKQTKRMLYTFSYYQFKEKLLWKAGLTNTTVFVVDEAYTSKTCGKCGVLNTTLGSSKTFHCKQCSFHCDRDVNGARNILLRNWEEVCCITRPKVS